jgi:hypothetical protein
MRFLIFSIFSTTISGGINACAIEALAFFWPFWQES